ncbi:FG-GAP-like repeat-containing protein [Limnoglobus roseus]|uniref:VCBS repeat-containing protein n=1 Tax=Limnoglobus roseus TaxID=2598579 RepID=A0A5C1A5P2_9BACT|nr:FG-GAP-like repeat-containing protein [Limnoglobus roseus]QEL13673.1 VCBS repeat-containing protein [Limnoglobus roseus]
MRRNTRTALRFESLEERLIPTLGLDPSFGVGGRTFVTPGPVSVYGTVNDAVVRPDGKIWVLGGIGGSPVLARFNPNGELDATFDGDGIEPILSWSGQSSTISLSKMALQADGRVVLAGVVTENNGPSSFAPYSVKTSLVAIRLNSDGTYDDSFGDGGRAVVNLANEPGSYYANTLLAVRVFDDGHVVLAGNEYIPVYPALTPSNSPTAADVPGFFAARLTAGGELDTAYGTGGVAVAASVNAGNSSRSLNSINGGTAAILADDRVVFSGTTSTPYATQQVSPQELFLDVYRLAADGSPDATFNGTGFAETVLVSVPVPDGGSASIYAYAISPGVQPDGKITIAANVNIYSTTSSGTESRNKILVTRFTADGQRDGSFADNGVLTARDQDGANTSLTLGLFTVLPDGRLVVEAETQIIEQGQARYDSELRGFTANGQVDGSFGPNGVLPTLTSAVPGESINPAILVPDGNGLLAAGATTSTPSTPTTSRIGLARLANDPPAVPPTANNQNPVGRFVVTSGSTGANLDPTFNGGRPAILSLDVGGVSGSVTATAVDAAGKYVVLGRLFDKVVVARYNADGTLDTSFDGDGVRTISPTGDENLNPDQLLIQPDGKIVITGSRLIFAPDVPTSSKVFVKRLNADGSDDTTFGGTGQVLLDSASPSQQEYGTKLAVLTGGRLQLVALDYANTSDSNRPRVVARRLNADGTLDSTYGTGGVVLTTVDASQFDQVGGIEILADGSVVIAGAHSTATSSSGPISVYAVALRLNAAGVSDSTFGNNGYAQAFLQTFSGLGTSSSSNYVTTPVVLVSAQPGGGIVVGTQVNASSYDYPAGGPQGSRTETRFQLVRFTAAGQPDATFGDNGSVILDSKVSDSVPSATTNSYLSLVALPNGGLSLLSSVSQYFPSTVNDAAPVPGTAALSIAPTPISVTVRRLTATGQPDSAFGILGAITVGTSNAAQNSLMPYVQAIDAAGRVVLGGSGSTGLGLERLSTTTSLFATKQPTVYVSGANGTVEAFRPAPDGTLVSAGTFAPFLDYTGAVRVATGDLNGDGFADTIFTTGDRGSKVRILLGLDPEAQPVAVTAPLDLDVFEASFKGGVSVTTGDVDGDGKAEFAVTPNVGGSGRVVVYSLVDGKLVVRANFFGIDDLDFRGGATAAFGDTDGDGKMELIVAAGLGGGPRVAVYRGSSLFSTAVGTQPPKMVNDFFAFPGADTERLRNGVAVAAGDVNGDGIADFVFGGGPGGAARVYTIDGKAFSTGSTVQLANFYVDGNDTSRGGVRLALKDVDGDGRAELIANATGTTSRLYRGTALAQSNAVEPTAFEDFDSPTAQVGTGVYVG